MDVCSPSREQMSCSGRSGRLGTASGASGGVQGVVLRDLAYACNPTLVDGRCRSVLAVAGVCSYAGVLQSVLHITIGYATG